MANRKTHGRPVGITFLLYEVIGQMFSLQNRHVSIASCILPHYSSGMVLFLGLCGCSA